MDFESFLSGMTPYAIARDLNRREIPTVTGVLWTINGVLRVLDSRHVAGILIFRKTEIGPGAWPAIIDAAMWKEVRERRAFRAAVAREKYAAKHFYWLASLEARAWSVLGNGAASRQAIERADTLRDQTTPDELDRFGGICYFPRVRQLYYAADATATLQRLHSSSELNACAESYATEAVESYDDAPDDEKSFGDQSGARTDLAIIILNVHYAISGANANTRIARAIQEEIEEYCRNLVAALPR